MTTNPINRILSYIMLLSVIVAVTGCKADKVYKKGVAQCSQDDWRAKINAEINREIMFHENAVVEIRSADDDNARQI